MEQKKNKNKKEYTLSEFRKEARIPLILAKRMIAWGEVKAERALDGTIKISEEEVSKAERLLGNPIRKVKYFLKALGPGVIIGAADDDPSGIGTYSSVGAKFGFSTLWMAVWLLPIMVAVQEICARIGIITNKGLAEVLQKYYHRRIIMAAVILLVIANIVNIGADLGAMAASLQMISGINFYLAAVAFAAVIVLLEVFIHYRSYVKFLKWLTLSVFAYVIVGIIIHPDWSAILGETFIPEIHFSKEYLFAIVAIFGTTISPYLFFWQTSGEVEENGSEKNKLRSLPERVGKMRVDVGVGALLANVVFFFIVLTTAQVLFKNGINNIESAQQAAETLRPLAGQYAYLLFALGIIGTGLLAIPILASSGAYALAELFKWKGSLELKFSQARGFYLVIAFSVIVGLLLNLVGINPIRALYYAAFLNGIVVLPLMVLIMKVGNNHEIMNGETHPKWVKFFGWLGVIFMAGAVATTVILQI